MHQQKTSPLPRYARSTVTGRTMSISTGYINWSRRLGLVFFCTMYFFVTAICIYNLWSYSAVSKCIHVAAKQNPVTCYIIIYRCQCQSFVIHELIHWHDLVHQLFKVVLLLRKWRMDQTHLSPPHGWYKPLILLLSANRTKDRIQSYFYLAENIVRLASCIDDLAFSLFEEILLHRERLDGKGLEALTDRVTVVIRAAACLPSLKQPLLHLLLCSRHQVDR